MAERRAGQGQAALAHSSLTTTASSIPSAEDMSEPAGRSKFSLWRIVGAMMFMTDEDLLLSHAGGGLVYEHAKSQWTWAELFADLLHEDNTVALRTVCGCRREEGLRAAEAAPGEDIKAALRKRERV